MKRAWIVALACLNVALVLALVMSLSEPVAQAQFKGNADYLMIPAHVDDDTEAMYVFDVNQVKLTAFKPNPNKQGKLDAYQMRPLKQDFEK